MVEFCHEIVGNVCRALLFSVVILNELMDLQQGVDQYYRYDKHQLHPS